VQFKIQKTILVEQDQVTVRKETESI